MIIGTSLSKCLTSIVSGEVSPEDVLVIVTGTKCEDYDSYIGIVKHYHETDKTDKLKNCSLDTVLAYARYLWDSGKIHQPRLSYAGEHYLPRYTSDLKDEHWLEIFPIPGDDNIAVKDAYDKYKMLCNLTK